MATLIGPLLDQGALRRAVWPGDGEDGSALSRTAFLRRLANDPTFPTLRVGGRRFYPEAEVRGWLAERVEGPTDAEEPAPRRRGRPRRPASVAGRPA